MEGYCEGDWSPGMPKCPVWLCFPPHWPVFFVPSFQDQPPCVGKARQYLVTAGIVRAALAVGWGPVEALLRALKHSRSTEAQVEWQNGREG